jgi:hypothetical protein
MKPKTIITVVLLAFVAASMTYMVIKESGGKENASNPALSATGTNTDQTETQSDTRLIAYYFHGNMRCKTCKTIEAYSTEAIEAGFPDAIRKGKLEFRVVNIEEPANEHFVQDYQLTTRTVVLAQYSEGKQKNWKNLQRVWELVGDHDAFIAYVQEETRSLLEGGSEWKN